MIKAAMMRKDTTRLEAAFHARPQVIELGLYGDFAPLAGGEFFLQLFDEGLQATDAGFEFNRLREFGGRPVIGAHRGMTTLSQRTPMVG
jgi:hypothetical protein